MTLQGAGGAAAFSTSADAYAATMAPALEPVAREVIRRAVLAPGERVLDIGTGTGTAAGMARGEGRIVVGLDAARGMLDIARSEIPGVEFVESDFVDMPFADDAFDVTLAAHALLFADDRQAALREWLRVTAPGGRLSLSVPGPGDVVPTTIFAAVYDRFGISWGDDDYPTRDELAGWAAEAGWSQVTTAADPTIAIGLDDDEHFRTWLRVRSRGNAKRGWSDERRDRFAQELMAASPRRAGGGYRLPFGALYLTARRPA